MRLRAGQVAVIVVLMHDHHRGRAIDHRPIFFARFVDHPVIPTRTPDGEGWDVGIAGSWEEEEIASGGTMKLTLTIDLGPQTVAPVSRKIKRRGHIQIPALAQQNEFIFQLYRLFRRFHKIRHQDHVSIDDAKQIAVRVLARQLEHGRDQRHTVGITFHRGNMPHTQLTRRIGETFFLAKQNDIHIRQQCPRLDGVALDHRDMRISERLGSGK